MQLCRCPHCRTTFQVSIPPDNKFWNTAPADEEGLTYWVCLDCHKQGLRPVTADDMRRTGHDTSYRPHAG